MIPPLRIFPHLVTCIQEILEKDFFFFLLKNSKKKIFLKSFFHVKVELVCVYTNKVPQSRF